MVDLCQGGHVGDHVVALLVDPMYNTELETGSVQTRAAVIRTLLGELSVINVRLRNLKDSFLLHSHPQEMKEVEVGLV